MNYLVDCSNCPYIEEVEHTYEIGDCCPECGEWTLNVQRIEEEE